MFFAVYVGRHHEFSTVGNMYWC